MGEWKTVLKMKNTPGPGHNEGERSFSLTPNPPKAQTHQKCENGKNITK